MRIAVYSRALVPSHFYRRKVLAWQCSVCRKLFCRTVEQAEREPGEGVPVYVESAFRVHNCELVLVTRQERCDAQRPIRGLAEFWDATGFDRSRGER